MIFDLIENTPEPQGVAPALDVDALEAMLLELPQVDCPVHHHFGPGVYVRECHMPAGAMVVGHSHRDENLNVMLRGQMALLIDGKVSIVTAPYQVVGGPGRKVAYIIEDTVWLNVYETDETDIAKLEAMYVEKSPAWLSHHENAGAIT